MPLALEEAIAKRSSYQPVPPGASLLLDAMHGRDHALDEGQRTVARLGNLAVSSAWRVVFQYVQQTVVWIETQGLVLVVEPRPLAQMHESDDGPATRHELTGWLLPPRPAPRSRFQPGLPEGALAVDLTPALGRALQAAAPADAIRALELLVRHEGGDPHDLDAILVEPTGSREVAWPPASIAAPAREIVALTKQSYALIGTMDGSYAVDTACRLLVAPEAWWFARVPLRVEHAPGIALS